MPADAPSGPWLGFLRDLNDALNATVHLHCLGGFAIYLRYGLPRPTADIDVLVAFPSDAHAQLAGMAGKGSALHAKHRVCLDVVTQTTCPTATPSD